MERISAEDIARERKADIGPIREYSEEEKAEIWARQAKERKEKKEAEKLAKLAENESTAPLCLRAADSTNLECQLTKTTSNINNTCCQERVTKKPKKGKKPLADRVDFIPMYNHYINNPQYSASEVIFLSEIDCLMQRKKAPCHVSAQHLASAARITVETAYNILSRLERKGVIIALGYGDNRRTKDRIVAPKYSRFPTISSQILKEHGKEPAPF